MTLPYLKIQQYLNFPPSQVDLQFRKLLGWKNELFTFISLNYKFTKHRPKSEK